MQRSDITTINNITQAIANPAAGDLIFLDIDETLLLTGFKKFSDDPKLTEPGLPAEILRLQERGIRVVGLTSRSVKKSRATLDQLKLAGIQLEVLHAPDIKSDDGSLHSGKGNALQAYIKQRTVKPKRIFVFDNLRHHLETIKSECEGLGIPLFLKHYVVPDFQPIHLDAESNAFFPEKLDGFQKEKSLGGGTASVFCIRHPERNQPLVLKLGAHEDGAKVEMLCNAVYRILGVDVPKMRVYHTLPKKLAADLGLKNPYRFSQLCEFIKSGNATPADIIKKAARDHFVAHALLGNIDVAKEDNFIVAQDSKAYLIDAGANFMFRSLGQPRKEAPHLVSEMETLRDKSFNDKGPVWFGDLTDEEISLQLQEILARNKELTEAVWSLSRHLQLADELRDKFLQCLADRIDVLVMRYLCQPEKHARIDKRAEEGKTSAGILTYAIKDGEPHILLSKRVRHEWWDNFGGKSETSDDSLLTTARREVAEESGQLLNYTDLELLDSPFHDLVTGKRGRDQHLYRMYISQYDCVNASEFKDKEHTAHQWVPLKDILAALDAGECKEFEKQKTVVVKTGQAEIPLYSPLFTMLQQLPVLENLRELQRAGQMKRRHTLSYAENIANLAPAVEYRPLLTPVEKRQQIAATLEKKSRVMRELKRQRSDDAETLPESAVMSVSGLSQSEMHLKAMLGEKYKDNHLAANVRKFIKKHIGNLPALQDKGEVERLVQYSVALIEQERLGGDKHTYFYHACSNSIAFAYDVYTAIYQALQQDAKWSAFRPDSVHFKQFLNINEFVAFYSKQGTKEISNNDKNYNDCALSANVFLFGNHTTATSCSIHYLLNNDVRRQVDMAALFEEMLRPFRVSSGEIKRILSVFEAHLREQKGRLYQIAMPVEQARLMSYPAGCVGVMKKLNGDHELPSVLQKLRAQVEGKGDVSTNAREYIKHLQARVMVPPHLKLKTAEVKWKPMSGAAEAAYRTSLTKVVDALVHKILCHHGAGNGRDASAPLLKVLPDILQSNQLSVKACSDDEALVAAILADDVVAVKKILHGHLELLQKKVRGKRNYMQNELGNTGAGEVTFMQMILRRKKILLHELIDFTNDGWLEQLNATGIKTYKELKRIIKRLPDEHRLQVAMYHAALLNETGLIIQIMRLLPEGVRIKLANQKEEYIRMKCDEYAVTQLLPQSDKIAFLKNNIISAANLCLLLAAMPVEQRIDTANMHHHLLTSLDDIVKIIQLLPAALRFDFAMLHRDNLSKHDICVVIRELPDEYKLKAAETQHYRIKDIDNLCAFLSVLPEDAVPTFIATHQDKIKNGYDLYRVIQHLDNSQRSAYLQANEHKIQTGDNISDLLEFITTGINDRLGFAVRHQNKITCCLTLISVLSKLDVSYRLAFARDNQHTITTGSYLAGLLMTLPEEPRFEFALANIDKCQTVEEIVSVMRIFSLSRQRYELAAAFQPSKISGGYKRIIISGLLDHPDLLKLISDNITNVNCLIDYLDLLPKSEIAAAIVKYQQYITDGNSLRRVIECLDKSERYACVMHNQNLIITVYDLSSLMKLLSADERLQLAKDNRRLIIDTCAFTDVLEALLLEQRLSFALEEPLKIDDLYRLKHIAELLPADKRSSYVIGKITNASMLAYAISLLNSGQDGADLAYRYQHLIITGCDVEKVVKALLPGFRLSFANLHQHKVNNSQTIMEIISHLDEKDKFVYAMSCIAHVPGSFSADILEFFTPDQCLEFAKANQDKITNSYQMEKIVSFLPQASRLAFKKANVRTAEMLRNVMQQLPEDEQLAATIQYQHVITDYHDLWNVLCGLPVKLRLACALANQHKSQDRGCLKSVADVLMKSDSLSFMMNNLQNGNGLAAILRYLPEDERLAFANSHLDKITDMYELSEVVATLIDVDKHDFIMANAGRVGGGGSLVYLTLMIKPEFRSAFILQNQHRITSGQVLVELAVQLQPDEQTNFIIAHQDKIESGVELRRLMSMLPRELYLQFSSANQDKIKDIKELAGVVDLLDDREAYVLVKANYERLKSIYYLRRYKDDDGFYSSSLFGSKGRRDLIMERIANILRQGDALLGNDHDRRDNNADSVVRMLTK